MDKRAFWQQKLIQFFHDPPGKPFASLPKAGGQKNAAQAIFDAFQQHGEKRRWRYWYKSADWAAAGADRPNLYTPKQRGVSPLGSIHWPKNPVITHPLAPEQRVRIPVMRGTEPMTDPLEEATEPEDLLPQQLDVVLQRQVDAAREIGALIRDWDDANRLQHGFVVLWRRLREDLRGGAYDPWWDVMPSETRCPDQSIWDHLKVVTALAFMAPHGGTEPPRGEGAREPWMLRMTLGPVGTFIEQSRTTRDLWISSFLLADLVFAAMSPFIERYGPDCVVYPDLVRNPRADCWLYEEHWNALPEGVDPCTFAAVLPESFVVLLPRGGEGHLADITQLADASRQRVAARWKAYTERVQAWFERNVDGAQSSTFRSTWQRQAEQCPVYVTWTAIPWKYPGRLSDAESLKRPSLPAQPPAEPINDHDAQTIRARAERLQPWVPVEAWSRYEQAREVFARACLPIFQIERGFDYALTHHQLSVRHAIRLQTHPVPLTLEEPGEKCTLCGLREALHAGGGDEQLGARRQRAREFWQNDRLDPDRAGAERLCAICATKRFLIEADGDGTTINQLWAGRREDFTALYRDGKVRVPFPSTATIAAQAFLERVVRDPKYGPHLQRIVQACGKAGLRRTSFPNALPRLATCKKYDAHRFLEYEAEDVLFFEALDGKIQQAREKEKRNTSDNAALDGEALTVLRDAVKELRDVAGNPDTHVAVIRVDGDRMGQLLLGEAEAIAASWRDVLHPDVVKRLPERPYLMDAGWKDLLDAKRLMGPTLHAMVSRILGIFAHRIVPFVVEQEFSGRLIYVGGDDVLAMAPADEAIAIAARLQQLFSAAWVIDTRPDENPWEWRRPSWQGKDDPVKARRRFLIPVPKEGEIDPSQPWTSRAHILNEQEEIPVQAGWCGELLPMLGCGASLSAGVAIGHYKTPLSVLLRRSKELQKLAKERGRARVAFGHASRGGQKTQAVLPWGQRREAAHRVIAQVTDGFRNRHIPSRLPYKLRERAPALWGAMHQANDELVKLGTGLFRACMNEAGASGASADAGGPATAVDAALFLWLEGVRSCCEAARKTGRQDAELFDEAVEALLFCRELAGLGDRA